MAGETLRSWLAPRGPAGWSWASWGSATSLAFAPGRLGPWSTSVFTERATRRKLLISSGTLGNCSCWCWWRLR